ncbi:hypothetical protein [Amycolatopsis sp.]|uniref:hypothetical protein n=1 Tax=Amycolatopsis sp. TaxID=37632 RepID=UPI002DF94B6C|nr:hypothetical protein [Amycolatopsis sp.]
MGGHTPVLPALLLLTTTATRAATFARAAGQLITQHEDRLPFEDPADVLVVAACGHNPAHAITEACWKVPEAAAADLTLVELLSERLDAQAETLDRDARDASAQRQADLDVLRDLRSFQALPDWLDSEPAAEALHALIGTDPAAFLDGDSDLVAQVIEWGRNRRRIPRSDGRERAWPFVPVLEARHAALWAQQARLVVFSHDHLAAAEPRLCRLVATLADGHLAEDTEIAMLRAAPTRTRQQVQQDTWGDYPAQREATVEAHWAALNRRARRHTSREHLTDAYDNDHLIICDTCQIIYLKVGPDTLLRQDCPHCGGTIIDWTERAGVVPLARRLRHIDRRLSEVAG